MKGHGRMQLICLLLKSKLVACSKLNCDSTAELSSINLLNGVQLSEFSLSFVSFCSCVNFYVIISVIQLYKINLHCSIFTYLNIYIKYVFCLLIFVAVIFMYFPQDKMDIFVPTHFVGWWIKVSYFMIFFFTFIVICKKKIVDLKKA